MALVLSINMQQNNEVFIDNTRVTVDKIVSAKKAQITVHGDFMNEQMIIDDDKLSPIMKNRVMIGLGTDTNRGSLVRLVIEAPKSIKIEKRD